MAFTARPTSTDLLTKLVNQAHAFSIGNIIIFNGTSYVLAQADTLADSAGCMMVSIIPDSNSFYCTQTGWVNNLAGGPYTIGIQYYLSPTSAGNLTLVRPSLAGGVVLPCFIADTTTSGFFFGGSGFLIPSSSILNTIIETAATVVMTADTRYVVETTVNCDLTLPTSATLGQIIIIDNNSAEEVLIAQNDVPMQVIRFGNVETTVGVHGGLNSITQGDSVTLVCASTDNTLWIAEASQGSNWEVI